MSYLLIFLFLTSIFCNVAFGLGPNLYPLRLILPITLLYFSVLFFQKVILLREKFKKTILSLAKEASVNGEPIIRSMEYVFPNQGYALISDQFMLGNNILVAPFLEKGEGTRKIILPIGNWMSDGGKIFSGNKMIETKVPLNRIPYYVLVD